jgi:hypothetical protein
MYKSTNSGEGTPNRSILKVEYSYKMLKKLEAMREELYGPGTIQTPEVKNQDIDFFEELDITAENKSGAT